MSRVILNKNKINKVLDTLVNIVYYFTHDQNKHKHKTRRGEMRTIQLNTAKKQAKQLKVELNQFHNISKKAQEFLVKKGFEYRALGTGKQSYTSSKEIDIMKLNNTYLAGKFLVVGCANQGTSKGCTYYGFIKRIV